MQRKTKSPFFFPSKPPPPLPLPPPRPPPLSTPPPKQLQKDSVTPKILKEKAKPKATYNMPSTPSPSATNNYIPQPSLGPRWIPSLSITPPPTLLLPQNLPPIPPSKHVEKSKRPLEKKYQTTKDKRSNWWKTKSNVYQKHNFTSNPRCQRTTYQPNSSNNKIMTPQNSKNRTIPSDNLLP